MEISAYKTPKVIKGSNLFSLLDAHLPILSERSIVIITSKIISICHGRIQKVTTKDAKLNLIKREASLYLDNQKLWKSHGVLLTIKDHILIPNAGIDESNGNGFLILWPKDIHKTAAEIWRHLRTKRTIKHLGVIITDSHTTPLRWGTSGMGLSWAGFAALKDYIGSPDIFGRQLRVTKASVLDGLAAAAVVAMGEGNEQTPLALIADVPFVMFQSRPPTKAEIHSLTIGMAQDLYAPLLTRAGWQVGGVQ